jgi:hypothetical protein
MTIKHSDLPEKCPPQAWERPLRELPALTEQLATMCSQHTTHHNSLRVLCESAQQTPGKYLPHDLLVCQMTSKVAWMAGFAEAMSVVLKHIDSVSPAGGGTGWRRSN